MLTSDSPRIGGRGAFFALLLALLALSPALHAAPKTMRGSVRVQITTVEMNRSDVGRLAVITGPVTRRSNALAALKNAARRAHVSYVAAVGPTITAAVGRPVTRRGVTVTPLSVRNGRAYVRIRDITRGVGLRGRRVAHVIADTHLFHSGGTRQLAGMRLPGNRYRYVYATVTVVR